MVLRDPGEVEPAPTTELEILRHGIWELATLATGAHLQDPAYGARREIKDFAHRIKEAAEAARDAA